MCRLHTLRPKPKDPPYDMWGFGEVLLSLIPEGFPDDPEKHKRFVKMLHILAERGLWSHNVLLPLVLKQKNGSW